MAAFKKNQMVWNEEDVGSNPDMCLSLIIDSWKMQCCKTLVLFWMFL